MDKTSLGVAITGFGGGDNPEPGAAVSRTLRLGWKGSLSLTALGYDNWMTAAWSPRLVDRISILPPLARGDEVIFKKLIQLHRENPFAAIIPCLDLEIPIFSRLTKRLRSKGISVLVPTIQSLDFATKISLPHFCHSNTIKTPKTIFVSNPLDVSYIIKDFTYPLIIKGTVNGARIVHNSADAIITALALNKQWGGGVIVQEWIDGEEFCVAMLARRNGRFLGAVPMRKLITDNRGKGVVGAVIDDERLVKESKRILEALNWAGPLELEFIQDHRTGQLYLIEINNRFPNWIMLSHWARCNLVVKLLKETQKSGSTRQSRPRPGSIFVRDVEEVCVANTLFEELTQKGKVSSVPNSRPRLRNQGKKGGLTVAVTGVNAFGKVMPGIGVAKALRRASEVSNILGFGHGLFDSCLYRSDLFDKGYWVTPDTDADEFLNWISRIHRETKIDVIIPCLDFEIPWYSAISHELASIGIETLLPSTGALARVSRLHHTRSSNATRWDQFYFPNSRNVSESRYLRRALNQVGVPVVFKMPDAEKIVAYSEDEAIAIWEAINPDSKKNIVLQSFVEGDEFSVAGVCSHKHMLLGSISIKKLLTCDQGKTWAAYPVQIPKLICSLRKLLEDLRWCGPFEIEFIRDRISDRFALIEFNPRFPGWISYSADLLLNLPYVAVNSALGREVAVREARKNVLFTRNRVEFSVTPPSIAAFVNSSIVRHD